MRLYAYLIFALFVLHARAATIPEKVVPNLEKKNTDVVDEAPKPPKENLSSDQELIDPANSVKDVENNLRNSAKVAEDIPVTVFVENVQPDLKIGGEKEKESVNEIGSDEEYIKRPEVDLKNPGLPQRQEHENQNPEYFEDSRRTVTNVKQNIQNTQVLLKQGFQGVSDDIQQWFQNNEQINEIQQSIRSLQSTFTSQLTKIQDSIQTVLTPEPSKPVESEATQTQTNNLKNIKSQLSSLETNFNTGLQTLSDGVKIIATLRADSEGAANSEQPSTVTEVKPTPAEGGQPAPVNPTAPVNPPTSTNPILDYLASLQQSIADRFGSIQASISQIVSQNQPGAVQTTSSTPVGAQADEAAAATQRPPFWNGFPNPFQSISNLFNPQQNQAPAAQGAPTPVVQTLAAQPVAQPAPQPVAQSQPGPFAQVSQAFQNSPLGQGISAILQPFTTQAPTVALASASPAQVPAAAASPVAAASQPAQPTNTGPIRQIVERIQTTINNPEKPRDTDVADDEKGVLVAPIKGYGGHGGGSGDNNDGGELADKMEQVEEIKKDPIPEEKKEDEIKPEAVVDKTE